MILKLLNPNVSPRSIRCRGPASRVGDHQDLLEEGAHPDDQELLRIVGAHPEDGERDERHDRHVPDEVDER